MDDRDLNALKDIQNPEPAPGAQDRALNAAMLAFEEARKKSPAIRQGVQPAERPMTTFMDKSWEWIMERRVVVGAVAACLLIVPVAGTLVWQRTGVDKVIVSRLDTPKKDMPVKQERRSEFSKEIQRRAQELENRSKPAQVKGAGKDRSVADGKAGRLLLSKPKPEERPRDGASVTLTEADKSDTRVDTAARINSVGNKLTANPTAPAAPPARSDRLSGGRLAHQPQPGLYYRPYDIYGPIIIQPENRDRFKGFVSNPVKSVAEHPVSTFSIDVDTASYAFVRRMLQRGVIPSRDSVRVEEMINYFKYSYPRPENAETPFRPSVALYPTPWNPNTRLLHIAIKGHEIVPETKPRSNLVFLIDVSGSMSSQDKLPLLKSAFRLLVNRLDDEDSVSIVTYAGRAGTVLEPTRVKEKAKILAALDQLQSGGSTAGAQGIRQAYALAEQAFDKEGVNRVILATDGDFNVGITNVDELKNYIESKRNSGIFLSVLGFGQGNYNDTLMQALAQNGNGNAAYIDTLREAQKVLVEEAASTLFPIAKDVKIQIEFNPARVSEYRLIGYETRHLNRQDFNNDKVDAGDIGSGHSVTAIYEITPAGSTAKLIDDLRYQRPEDQPVRSNTEEYAFLKIRYKLPSESTSKLITLPVTDAFFNDNIDSLSSDIRFATSVAAFGQKLRGEAHLEDYSYDAIHALASAARGTDPYGYRGEFLSLVRLAKSLGETKSSNKSNK